MHTDTDPTPAHGTPRPTKTHVLDRQLAQLKRWRNVTARAIVDNQNQNEVLLNELDQLDSDIATIEQLITDLFPEPRD